MEARSYKEAAALWYSARKHKKNITFIVVECGPGLKSFRPGPTGLTLHTQNANRKRKVLAPRTVYSQHIVLTGEEKTYLTVKHQPFTKDNRAYRPLVVSFGVSEDTDPTSDDWKIRHYEIELNKGRFKNFSFEDFPHQFPLTYEDMLERDGAPSAVFDMVKNLNCRWSVGFKNISITSRDDFGTKIEYTPVLKMECPTEAMIFKLTKK